MADNITTPAPATTAEAVTPEVTPKQPVTPEVKTPEVKPPVSGEFTDKELEELNSQVDAASKTLVSEEVNKLLEAERKAAKEEAQKEFATNQRIKELEAEKEAMSQQRIADQREAASQLATLKEKVDSLAASRAVVSADNPFAKPPAPAETGFDVKTASAEVIDEIERNSMEAFFEQKRREI